MSAPIRLPASLAPSAPPAGQLVLPCPDGQRKILIEREGSVLVYSLYDPLGEGSSYGTLREIEGTVMGRSDTRRPDPTPEGWDYDAAIAWEEDRRRGAEEQILTLCCELRSVPGGTSDGTFRARGQIRFIGSFAARERMQKAYRQAQLAASQRRARKAKRRATWP